MLQRKKIRLTVKKIIISSLINLFTLKKFINTSRLSNFDTDPHVTYLFSGRMFRRTIKRAVRLFSSSACCRCTAWPQLTELFHKCPLVAPHGATIRHFSRGITRYSTTHVHNPPLTALTEEEQMMKVSGKDQWLSDYQN